MSLRFFFILFVVLLVCAWHQFSFAAEAVTARSVFAMLPDSIFENTPEGLEPAEKQRLLAEGHGAFWELARESDDSMLFVSLPLRDNAVALRLFRNTFDGSVQAALGTLGGSICTLELWRVDAAGRAVPGDTPEEPDVDDFFAKSKKIPPDVHATVMICLDLTGLKAEPQFWTRTGLAHVPTDNDVRYHWTGRTFKKKVYPHGEE